MRIVDSGEALTALIADLSKAPYLALDTEFLRDQTYYPKLCLIQVASPDGDTAGVEAIIDPLAHQDANTPTLNHQTALACWRNCSPTSRPGKNHGIGGSSG